MSRATREAHQHETLAVYNSRNSQMLLSTRLRWLWCVLLLAARIALASDRAANCPALNWPRDSEMTTGFCLDGSHGWKAIYDHVQNRTSIASTSDGGNNWTVQQLAPIGYSATAMFFLDQHDGWVGLYNPAEIKSSVAATVDGGKHWTVQQVDGLGYSPSSLFFLDTKHGWLTLFNTGSTPMNLQCKIVRTNNGGAMWAEIKERNIPPCGYMRFISIRTGWVIGNYGEGDRNRVWTTDDGGRTWISHAFPMPRNCKHCEIVFHEPAQFDDTRHGTFMVEMQASTSETLDVTYATDDGGRSWRIAKSVTEAPNR